MNVKHTRRRAPCSPTRSASTWPGSSGATGSWSSGPSPEDKAYADALRRAAKRFGHKIVEEREFKYDPGSRRSDGGFEQIQQQIPGFTQGVPEHHVVVVADEGELFGEYFPYRTWDAKPVIGTAGLYRDHLASRHRAMGRNAVPEPIQETRRPHHAPARLQRLDGRALRRRSRDAQEVGRCRRISSPTCARPSSSLRPSRARS